MTTLRFYTEETSERLYIGQYCTMKVLSSGLLFYNSLFSNRYELHCSSEQGAHLMNLLKEGASYAALGHFWKEEALEDRISLSEFIAMGYIE